MEILDLTMDLVDLKARVIMPNKMSRTKRTRYSFFNQECQKALRDYIKVRQDPSR
jgi:site-specific recombinase XerD